MRKVSVSALVVDNNDPYVRSSYTKYLREKKRIYLILNGLTGKPEENKQREALIQKNLKEF